MSPTPAGNMYGKLYTTSNGQNAVLKQVDILLSKNQALQILKLSYVYILCIIMLKDCYE